MVRAVSGDVPWTWVCWHSRSRCPLPGHGAAGRSQLRGRSRISLSACRLLCRCSSCLQTIQILAIVKQGIFFKKSHVVCLSLQLTVVYKIIHEWRKNKLNKCPRFTLHSMEIRLDCLQVLLVLHLEAGSLTSFWTILHWKRVFAAKIVHLFLKDLILIVLTEHLVPV